MNRSSEPRRPKGAWWRAAARAVRGLFRRCPACARDWRGECDECWEARQW